MDVNTDFDAECEAALVSLAAEGLPENLGEEDRSHDALALEMGRPWVTKARYVRPWDKWVFWDDQCWRFDEKLLHFTLAREFLRQKGVDLIAWAEAQREALIKEHGETKGNDKAKSLVDWAKGEAKMMRAAPFIAHVVGLARSNAELVLQSRFIVGSSAPVATSGALLVCSSPERPIDDPFGIGRPRPHQPPQQAPHLRHGVG